MLSFRDLIHRLKFSTFDQLVISGTGFAVSLLVARWGSPVQYGAYSTAQSFHLLGAGIHNALVVEPLGVIAPQATREQLPRHLMAAARYGTLIALACGLGGAVLAQVFVHSVLLSMAVAIASPLLITQIFVRRVCYAIDNQRAALLGSVLFLLAVLPALYFLHSYFTVTSPLAYVALAGGALAGTLGSLRLAVPSLGDRADGGERIGRPVHRAYLTFGSWLVLSGVVGWVNAGVYVPVVSKYLGLVQAGTLRAAELLFTPMDQFVTSVAILVIPLLSAQSVARAAGPSSAQFPFLRLQLLACGSTLLYGLIIFFNSHFFLHLFYGGATFSAAAAAVPGIGVSSVSNGLLTSGPGMKLRISGNTRGLFIAGLAGAIVSLTVGIPLMIRYGIAGAAGGRALAALTNLAVATWISTRGNT